MENVGLVTLLESMVKNQIANVTCHVEKIIKESAVEVGDKIYSK